MMILIVWLVILIAVLVVYYRRTFSRFSEYGIKHFSPLPVLGNMARVLFRKVHMSEDILELYLSFPNERYVGQYEFSKELIMIRDPELIKKITVKDFEHFMDHRTMVDNNTSLSSRSLMLLKGQEWKDMRSTLSPAFTSSKIRHMIPFMVEVGDQMMSSLMKKIQESPNLYIDLDVKDLTTRYTNDVIASCAFGLKVDSHTEPNNEFYAMGKLTSSISFRQMVIYFVILLAPRVAKFFDLDFVTDESGNFFRKLVQDMMKHREENNIIRPDMIHLLMEAKKGQLTHEDNKSGDVATGFATAEESSVGQNKHNRVWSDDDLIAQAVLFFVAGFESVASGMSFLLYELAVHPEVQERLAQEIKENDAKNDGKFDFNSIQNMKYLDMVLSEVLRLWPPNFGLERVCTKDYNLGKPNDKAEKDFNIRKGAYIMIPSFAIHRDPEYFPDPDKFDPERFSEENKDKIKPFTYMPFGAGPRNCIGSRFALSEIKVIAYQILRYLEVSPCEKTCIPPKLNKQSFTITLEGGDWLRFKPRR